METLSNSAQLRIRYDLRADKLGEVRDQFKLIIHSLKRCTCSFNRSSDYLQLLIVAQACEGLLDSKGCETSCRVLVPAIFHDLWHAMKNVGWLPAIRNIWPLVIDANNLMIERETINFTKIILESSNLLFSSLQCLGQVALHRKMVIGNHRKHCPCCSVSQSPTWWGQTRKCRLS